MLDKKSVKINGIKEFSWSPTDSIVGYWIAEQKDVPAKVSLMAFPSREEVKVAYYNTIKLVVTTGKLVRFAFGNNYC